VTIGTVRSQDVEPFPTTSHADIETLANQQPAPEDDFHAIDQMDAVAKPGADRVVALVFLALLFVLFHPGFLLVVLVLW
jgi:hypothetical protein